MPTTRSPRKGTLAVWPRRRAKRSYSRVRSWARAKEAKPLGFGGYKVGMGRVRFTDTRSSSPIKNKQATWPVTIIECPPVKVLGISYYQDTPYGKKKVGETRAEGAKTVTRKVRPLKQKKGNTPETFDELRLIVHTQPHLTGIGKKKPEVFEVGLGGSKDEQAAKAQELLGKDLNLKDVFETGAQVDTHTITKGKGFQGPVKRQGVSLRNHKSEKGVRGPANLGSWTGNRSWTVPHAGQMGYHQRTDYNKWVLAVGEDPNAVTKAGGINRYGVLKNPYLLIKGSVGGPKKRLVRVNTATRPNSKYAQVPEVEALFL